MYLGYINMSKPIYWYFKNILSLKEVKQINNLISKKKYPLEPDSNKATNSKGEIIKYLHTRIVKLDRFKKHLDRLYQQVLMTNRHHWGYDLFELPIEQLYGNYNVYESTTNDNYDWHIDCTKNAYVDIKLTILINLSEKQFEGGDLFIQEAGEPFIINELKEPGSMVIFKSYLRHTVTPVTKGIRKNLAMFLEGPKFR